MEWIEQVKKNIIPLSEEKEDLKKAFEEWSHNNNVYDLEEAKEVCGLCGQSNLRYQFEIENQKNGNTLLVGSECINKFGIKAIDEDGNILDEEETKKKLSSNKYKLVTNAKEKAVIEALIKLVQVDEEFNSESFLEYYKNRKAFTPFQLATLVWRLNKNSIEYKHLDFKVIIRRDREKEQLLKMEDWKLKKIWPFLSSYQKKFCKQNRKISFT